MAPVAAAARERRPRGGQQSEKTTTTAKGRGGHKIDKKMATTKKGRGGKLPTEKNTMARKRRDRGQGTEKKTTISDTRMKRKWEEESDRGADSDDYPIPDRETVISEAKTMARDSAGEKIFKNLNTFLRSQGLSAESESESESEPPYKYAIHKLLEGGMNEKVRARISKYISQKVGYARRILFHLLSVRNWDGEVAGLIAEVTKEAMENLEVDVKEIREIFELAEEVRNESEKWRLMKGEALKDRVRSCWFLNTMKYTKTVRKWVDNPTSLSFSIKDVPYNDFYERARLCYQL